MAAAKKQCLVRFLYWTESSPTVIQSSRFTNDYKFGISVADISNLTQIRINTRNHIEEKPYLINSYFFFKIGKAKKKVKRVSKMQECLWVRYVLKDFLYFFLVTKKCEK